MPFASTKLHREIRANVLVWNPLENTAVEPAMDELRPVEIAEADLGITRELRFILSLPESVVNIHIMTTRRHKPQRLAHPAGRLERKS